MKRIIAVFLVLTMLFSLGGVSAAENGYKDESIYGILDDRGSVSDLYVVNAVHGSSVDYGSYEKVVNLSTLDQLKQHQDEITLPAYEDTFYYQGNLGDQELPWDFKFVYTLNGQEVDAQDLSGAEGELSIEISIKTGAVALQSFFEGYALQISLALSDDLCQNIKAEGATLVEAGGKKQIAFTILPGKEANLKVSASVKDFVMDPMTINAVKMVFDMDVDTTEFTAQIDELITAVVDLDDGASSLLEGLKQLSTGLTQYKDGMGEYLNGLQGYAEQGIALSNGLKGLANGLVSLKDQNDALKTGISGLEAGVFQQVDEQLAQMGMTLPALTKENYQSILGGQDQLAPIVMQIEQTMQLTTGLAGYLDGVGQLAAGSTELSTGLDAYVQGASKLATSTQNLYNGAVSINDGLIALRDGMAEYQAGTATFKKSTSTMKSDMDQQIHNMLEEFMGKSGETVSFVSSKNSLVSSVQFFFRTKGIVKEEIKVVNNEEPKTYTFWERLLKLFGLLK